MKVPRQLPLVQGDTPTYERARDMGLWGLTSSDKRPGDPVHIVPVEAWDRIVRGELCFWEDKPGSKFSEVYPPLTITLLREVTPTNATVTIPLERVEFLETGRLRYHWRAPKGEAPR